MSNDIDKAGAGPDVTVGVATEAAENDALHVPANEQDNNNNNHSESNITTTNETSSDNDSTRRGLALLDSHPPKWYSYLATPDFWLLTGLGQILALCITATNTLTTLLANAQFNAPAFQTFFNYSLLAIVYTALVLVRDGPSAWLRAARVDGLKYIALAALDVEANYFTVLAYQYTNLLSAQLLNFWSIVCVVAASALLLRVRYRKPQLLGILVCCGGMGILLGSDHLQGRSRADAPARDMLRGDLFGLLGATLYGCSNVLEEWLVSKAPMHHVLAFIGLLGMIINGVQAAIFDRNSIATATWSPTVAACLVGYTLCLFLFYTLAPLMLRMGSAAFFDVSLLTANFWGVLIGVRVFGFAVHFLYPVAFACIVLGLALYFLSGSLLGDSRKPWLGRNQEHGVEGIGTAKRRAIRAARAADEAAVAPDAVTAVSTSSSANSAVPRRDSYDARPSALLRLRRLLRSV